jgi:hypothetical protein
VSRARVIALVATIPARRRSVERLLSELARQSRVPDAVVLVMDGYPEADTVPNCPLPLERVYRSVKSLGPGARWRVAKDVPPDDVLVAFDDDIMLIQAPSCVEVLTSVVEASPAGVGSAAAAMGRQFNGKPAPPGNWSTGDLMYVAGCGLTLRARALGGLQAFAEGVKAADGPDALGVRGDDDALVSAYLWKNNVRMIHAATGNIFPAPNTRSSSFTVDVMAHGLALDEQKKSIARITGWPWRMA